MQQELKQKHETDISKITIKQLFDEYVSVKKYEVRESTLDKFIRVFNCYVSDDIFAIRLDKLTTKVLQEWKISMEQKGLSLTTKKNAYTAFKAIFNYAVKMEYISKNPLDKVGNFKDSTATKNEMDFYTPEEFKKFINVAKDMALSEESKHNLYEWNFYVFFCIAFYTGLRKGEINGLIWSDIDNGYLSVKRSINQKLKGEDIITPPKNKSSIRTIQLPIPLINILNEHKERQKQLGNYREDKYILGDERALRDSTIQKRNVLYAQLAGVKHIRIHDFRHSHASLLANMGINIQEIARRLGHSKIEITWNTYSHLYPKEEERAMKILNAV